MKGCFLLELIFSGFWSAFWLFLGVVAGAAIQHWLSKKQFEKHQSNARLMLMTEVEMNLAEIEALVQRIKFLKERVSAGQIAEEDLYFPMHGFDYSAVAPLVNSGHFHSMLGAEGVKSYLGFMRFFNNENAKWLSSMLVAEHQKGKSMDFLDWVLGHCDELPKSVKGISQQA